MSTLDSVYVLLDVRVMPVPVAWESSPWAAATVSSVSNGVDSV